MRDLIIRDLRISFCQSLLFYFNLSNINVEKSIIASQINIQTLIKQLQYFIFINFFTNVI